MNEVAFKMYLKPNSIEEYRKRHDKIWPELKALLKESQIASYNIYYDAETNCLFAFQHTNGRGSQSLVENTIVKKWWRYMSDLMETNPDSSHREGNLTKVFSL